MKAAANIVRVAAALSLSLLVIGCAGEQSALSPHGPEAGHLARLFWVFTTVCAVVWLLVMTGLAVALLQTRRRDTRPHPDPLLLDRRGERTSTAIVGVLVGMTAIILIILTLYSYFATRSLAAANPSLNIEVTGHQWWWEITYDDADPLRIFQTANEIHVPVGKTVKFTLRADDVIHSFWVPPLGGKQDLIPGVVNTITFTPTQAGTYRGQCAEFCGLQHAHMALLVIAQSDTDFAAWREQQLKPAASLRDGQQVFFAHGCALCHAIRGSSAGGRLGPDLTHFGSRETIAAGALPNTKDALRNWISNPQGVKPGNRMPDIPLRTEEVAAIEAYLEGLR